MTKVLFWGMVLFQITIFAGWAEAESGPRVPAVFTGNSPAPEYQNYESYRNKKDTRDSRSFAEYFLAAQRVGEMIARQQVESVHVHVRNIAVDGLCGSAECFRAYVFVNGDQDSGEHVATFVVSPGMGGRTPQVEARPLRLFTRYLTKYEKPTQFGEWDMYRIYGSKSYPGSIPNMPNAMFILDSIALHGSFDTVDGNKRSHGCVRMFPDESYWLHSLVRSAQGQLTVDILHTR